MDRPRIILGAGGHAKVLIAALRSAPQPAWAGPGPSDDPENAAALIGLTDTDPIRYGSSILGVRVIGDDDEIDQYPAADIELINGLGGVASLAARRRLYERFADRGYRFAKVIHHSAVIAGDADLGPGTQVMAGAVIQPGCRIGRNAIINTRAGIDHDCQIADHAHIAPGATLCGQVRVGEQAFVGAGATVIQGVRLGDACHIAAGAVVVRDVPPGTKTRGVPAREFD